MLIADGSKMLMIGDSVTDVGRARPVGRKQHDGLGNGYVKFFDAMLTSRYPERNFEILNMGISGNKVTDLETRWQTDVLDLNPNWLSIMIGINDVWRHYDSPCNDDLVDAHLYEKTYRTILDQVRSQLDGLILATPYFIEANRQDPMRIQMESYGSIVKQLAADFDAIFVDTQAAFDVFLEHKSSHYLAWDRIHPNGTGHTILSNAFLRAVQYEF